MRRRRIGSPNPPMPPNEAARLYEFNADDLFARRGRLRVDSSLGQESRVRRLRPGPRRSR